MKIAIFGVSGQLGRDVAATFARHDVLPIDHSVADLRDPDAVRAAVAAARPAWVINCAAMTHVDRCETESLLAFEVNALGAASIADAADAAGARMLHVSTDYVFDGATTGAYTETDPPNPINTYGMSKLAGEWAVRASRTRPLVVRSSGLYGRHICRGKGTNFVETMLTRAAAGPLRVVSDEVLTPTFTEDLAGAMAAMIERDAPEGIYHVTNAGHCSWYEFAREIVRIAGINTTVEPILAAEWKAPARRPARSVLNNVKFASLGIAPLPDWRDALARYLGSRRPDTT